MRYGLPRASLQPREAIPCAAETLLVGFRGCREAVLGLRFDPDASVKAHDKPAYTNARYQFVKSQIPVVLLPLSGPSCLVPGVRRSIRGAGAPSVGA